MFRKLTAIEIAEGALLADIAIVFRFVATFLPGSSSFLTLLNFTVFTILTLRRGLYVALMGSTVAMVLMCVLIGPHALINMTMECLAGMFLGVTMRWRWPPLLLAVVGGFCGALFLYAVIIVVGLLTGVTANDYLSNMQRSIDLAMKFINLVASRLGQQALWQQLHPQVMTLIAITFTYWYISIFVVLFVGMCPVVLVIYAAASSLIRLMGYDVRPFPSAKLNRHIRRLRRRVVKAMLRRRQARRLRAHREGMQWDRVA